MTAGSKRLGIFGGAFDPPHAAHRALLEAAVEQLQLDEVRVIPTGQAWHKTRQLTPAPYRLAMAELAFSDVPGAVVDPRETLRAGPSYTLDTVREIKAEQPHAELFLVIGADQANALPNWHEWREIPRLAIICVAERQELTRGMPQFSPPAGLESRYLLLQMPFMPISATDIRSRLAARQDVGTLVAEPVARYIAHHHLYQTA